MVAGKITPAEVGGLVERLRAVTNRMTQDFDGRDDLMREAATALEAQAAELAAVRAERDSFRRKQYHIEKERAICYVSKDGETVSDIYDLPIERMPNGYDFAEEIEAAEARAERAEAARAEARKALGTLIVAHDAAKQNWEQTAIDAQRAGNYELRNTIINTALQALSSLPVDAARCALTGGEGE